MSEEIEVRVYRRPDRISMKSLLQMVKERCEEIDRGPEIEGNSIWWKRWGMETAEEDVERLIFPEGLIGVVMLNYEAAKPIGMDRINEQVAGAVVEFLRDEGIAVDSVDMPINEDKLILEILQNPRKKKFMEEVENRIAALGFTVVSKNETEPGVWVTYEIEKVQVTVEVQEETRIAMYDTVDGDLRVVYYPSKLKEYVCSCCCSKDSIAVLFTWDNSEPSLSLCAEHVKRLHWILGRIVSKRATIEEEE